MPTSPRVEAPAEKDRGSPSLSRSILIENSTFYPNVLGGAEMSSWLLAKELTRRGWKVHALASTGRLDEGLRDELSSRKLEGIDGEILEAIPAGSMHLLPREGDAAPGIVRRGIQHVQEVRSLLEESIIFL